MARRTVAYETVGGRRLELSNLDKVLFPADGCTKGDLIAYYRAVAPYVLPYLAGRPLTLQRYPDGVDGFSFFEKDAPRGTPEWVRTVALPSAYGRRDEVRYLVCDDETTLVWLANLAAIVLHVWTSRLPDPDVPDMLLFDLDPGDGCTVARLGRVAVTLRDELAAIGLSSLAKTTGGSGIHVVIPLELRYTFDVAKAFAEIVARRVAALLPEDATLQRATARRPETAVYLDYVQVGRGKTMVAPYSVRARAGAPVSMPLAWPEVEAMVRERGKDTAARNARYTLANVPGLLRERGDAWAGGAWRPQRLERPLAAARKAWA